MRSIIIFCILFSVINLNKCLSGPKRGYADAVIVAEQNPLLEEFSIKLAENRHLPVSIISQTNVFAKVKYIEDQRPVYTVAVNIKNPYAGGFTCYAEDLKDIFDFSKCRIDFGNGNIIDNTGNAFQINLSDNISSSKVLMVPESSNDRIYIFDSFNGDLIDTAFIPQTRPQLQTSIMALQEFNMKNILVSDQISDVVQKFNLNGIYNSVFAPAGGVNNSILDNIRGMSYRDNNNLLVAVGGGVNINTIQEFDTSGVNIGTFISSNLDGPFGILRRQNSILVSNGTASAATDITKNDLNGNFISAFHSSANLNFAEQMIQLPNGEIVVAGFSLPSGLVVLDSSGGYKKTLNVVTGNRGVYLLGNGHYLTTAGTSVYELDSANGNIIRTIAFGASFSFRFISEYNFANPTLRLTINTEACLTTDVFSAELRSSSPPYNLIDSQVTTGGLSIPSAVSFPSAVNGMNYYIVINGRNIIETWSAGAQAFSANYLKYNFTTSQTQAFGNNLINKGGKWSMYQGDINQDDFIDLTDIILVSNDALLFANGYFVTDINCDGFVDLTDIIFCVNNSSAFIQTRKP